MTATGLLVRSLKFVRPCKPGNVVLPGLSTGQVHKCRVPIRVRLCRALEVVAPRRVHKKERSRPARMFLKTPSLGRRGQ